MKQTKITILPKDPKQSKIIFTVIAVVIIGFACIASILAFFTARSLTLHFPGTDIESVSITSENENEYSPDTEETPGSDLSNLGSVQSPISLTPWDGASRVTVLILGLDYRDWSANEGPPRSDTMILLTLDPLTNTAGILSIPRDLWVSIPGFKHGKINTAYYLGEAYKLPGGGPQLAVNTVEQLLGVPINFYAQVDFGAFVRFIDEIGGVPIDVPEPIKIDLLGGGFKTKKKLDAGRQVLPGEWALAYARARYTEGGDFDRAQRQQQVIMAIRERVLSKDLLPVLIHKGPVLYQELASGIHTNMSFDDIYKLALLAVNVPDENILRGAIGKEEVIFGFSPDNLSILIPIPDKIHLLRDRIFTTYGLSPETPGNSQQRMQAEGAKLAVYDGTGNPNLLSRTIAFLKTQGATIVQSSPANQNYSTTVVIDHTGNPFTVGYLIDLMNIPQSNFYVKFDPNSTIDVEVFLGSDWANNNKIP